MFIDDLTQYVPAVGVILAFVCPASTDIRFNVEYLDGNFVMIAKDCAGNGYGSEGCFNCKEGFYLQDGVCIDYQSTIRFDYFDVSQIDENLFDFLYV